MDTSQKRPLIERIQERLAASRFLTFSLLLHVILIFLAGSVVLFRHYSEPPDFVAEGGVVGSEVSIKPLQEEISDPTAQESTAIPDQPTLTAPTLSAITTTSTTTNSFSMVAAPVPVVKAIGEIKATSAPRNLGGGIGTRGLPGTMGGRAGGSARTAAMQKNGGKDKSEKAVLAGLRWLQKQQAADGSWGGANKPAMSGLALLCFLGHGETPEAPEFGPTVKKGVDWLMNYGIANEGRLCTGKAFSQQGVYEHGIATYALGEYYTMTKDDRVKDVFIKAIEHIIKGQSADGGWMYSFVETPVSDTSVTGWQVQALKAAHLSGLEIAGVDKSLDKAMLYLKGAQGPKGGFGYRGKGDKYSLTGVGVLCTYFWKQDKDDVVKDGIAFILEESEKNFPVKYNGEHGDLYAWYYHTQACLMYGGSAWTKWNKMFQDEIADNASPDGSWPPLKAKGHGGQSDPGLNGAIYRTTLCILMLEVFYRYMPTTK